MPRHDSIFKALLRSFFADLLWLVVPNLARSLDLAHPVFLDKEFFTAGGRRRELDLLARVSLLGDGGHAFLIHVEVEARATAGMGRRLWRYHNKVQDFHDCQVLPIVLYLERGKAGVQVQGLTDDLLGPHLGENFRYVAFGLAGCEAADYLARPEPLAWALAALMRRGPLSRPALKLACLRRIAAADLDDARRILLVDCVETYLGLNSDEAEEYARLYTVRENREVRKMAMTWSQRIAAEGREEGIQEGMQAGLLAGRQEGLETGLQEGLRAVKKVLLGLLEKRFGPLPLETRARVEAITSLDRLTRLSERALTVRSLAALRL
jgi:hypothetical protein